MWERKEIQEMLWRANSTALSLRGYGLWNDLAWGEWLGALSGGLYIPFEVGHLIHRPSVIIGVVLAVNVFMFIFLAIQLWSRRTNDTSHK